jgi:hypothetical protein
VVIVLCAGVARFVVTAIVMINVVPAQATFRLHHLGKSLFFQVCFAIAWADKDRKRQK